MNLSEIGYRLKSLVKCVLPVWLKKIAILLYRPRDAAAVLSFLLGRTAGVAATAKIRLISQILTISVSIDSPHTNAEILKFIRRILELSPSQEGVLVEAGCFKGSSTAKFSLAAAISKRQLVVFDSFKGIPPNNEKHGLDFRGNPAGFSEGDFCGSLEEVKQNVRKFGAVECCRFVEGFFEDTMPLFHEKVIAAYLDVDLVSSTRTCIKFLYPLLVSGGSIFSQDGHLPLVTEALSDAKFWSSEVHVEKPVVKGIGSSKILQVTKV